MNGLKIRKPRYKVLSCFLLFIFMFMAFQGFFLAPIASGLGEGQGQYTQDNSGSAANDGVSDAVYGGSDTSSAPDTVTDAAYSSGSGSGTDGLSVNSSPTGAGNSSGAGVTGTVYASGSGADSYMQNQETPQAPQAPTFSPSPGQYGTPQQLTISCGSVDASVYYTLDGSDPETDGLPYTSPLTIDHTLTVQAVVYQDGVYSAETSGQYIISAVNLPNATAINIGDINSGTLASPNGAMWYSFQAPADGAYRVRSFPIQGGSQGIYAVYLELYDSSLSLIATPDYDNDNSGGYYAITRELTGGRTYYVKAYCPRGESGDFQFGVFAVPNPPAATPPPGVYDSPQSVSLTTYSAGAAIYYTLDGSQPTESSMSYTGPITIDNPTEIRAVASLNGQLSDLATFDYLISTVNAVYNLTPGEFAEGNIINSTDQNWYSLTVPSPGRYLVRFYPGDSNTYMGANLTIFDSSMQLVSGQGQGLPVEDGWQWNVLGADLQAGTYYIKVQSQGSTGSYKIEAWLVPYRPDTTPPVDSNGECYLESSQDVALTCDTPSAVIYYTVNGDDVYQNGIPYTAPISFDTQMNIEAVSVIDGVYSDAVWCNYYVVAPPAASPDTGTLDRDTLVQLTATPSWATIYYTTDGSDPTVNSNICTGPILVDHDITIKAVSYINGILSAPAVFSYTRLPGPAAPAADPAPGAYSSPQQVTLTCPDPDAEIYYTTDGSLPSDDGTLYSAPFPVSTSLVVEAASVKDGVYSNVYDFNYTIVTPPYASIDSGAYTSGTTIYLYTNTPGATINYTIDGSSPVASGQAYTEPIILDHDLTVRAVSVYEDVYSGEASYQYTITAQPPSASPPPDIYSTAQYVYLTTDQPDAEIYYTIDGTAPSTSSSLYTGPILVDHNMQIRAAAFWNGALSEESNGWNNPPGLNYNITVARQVYANQTLECYLPNWGQDEWFRFDTPSPGKFNFRTLASNLGDQLTDTYLTLWDANMNYLGSSGSGYNDESGNFIPGYSLISQYLNPGTYNIRVSGANYYDRGRYQLSVEGNQIAAPTGDPAPNTITSPFKDSVSVSLSVYGTVGNIYYTLDGTDPTTDSTLYSGPITLSQSTTIRAINVTADGTSDISDLQYYVDTSPPVVYSITYSTSLQSWWNQIVPGQTLNKNVQLNAGAWDDTVVSEVYYAYSSDNGDTWEDIGAVSGQYWWPITWDTTQAGGDGSYLLRAVAVDSVGRTSDPYTVPVNICNTPPPAPQNLTIVPEQGGLNLSWSPPLQGNPAGYNIYRGTSADDLQIITNTADLSYADTSVSASAYYYYAATAYDQYGNESERTPVLGGEPLPDTTPPQITYFWPDDNARVNGNIYISLEATDNAGVKQYTLELAPAGSENWSTFGTSSYGLGQTDIWGGTSLNTSSYPDGAYSLRVTATDFGDNAASVSRTVYFDNTPPPAVTGLSAQASPGSIDLTWSLSAADDVANYEIYRSQSGNSYSFLASVSADVYNYSDTSLVVGTQYSYEVRAVDTAGNDGEFSNPVTATAILVLPPTASPLPGTYNAAQQVALSSDQPDAVIYYTLDGSAPTTASNLYTGPITVDRNMQIRAITFMDGVTSTEANSGAYPPGFNYNITVARQVYLNQVYGGYIPSSGQVEWFSFSTTSPGNFKFRTKASSLGDQLSQSTLDLCDVNMNSLAYCFDYYYENSNYVGGYSLVSQYLNPGTYYILVSGYNGYYRGRYQLSVEGNSVLAPVGSPAPNTVTSPYKDSVSVTLSVYGTAGSIYYTLDGSTPTTNSTLYTGPITLTKTTTIKAINVTSSGTSDTSALTYYVDASPPVINYINYDNDWGSYYHIDSGQTFNKSVTLWTSNQDDTGVSVTSFAYSADGMTWNLIGNAIGSSGSITWDTTQVGSDGMFLLRAIATDYAGRTSIPYVVEINLDNTPPPAPQNLTVTPIQAGFTLSWNAPAVGNPEKYQIYRGTSPDNLSYLSYSYQSTTYIDEPVAGSTDYYYAVTALDNYGNESTRTPVVNAGSPLSDTTPPQITYFWPADNGTLGGTNYPLIYASDNGSIEQALVEVQPAGSNTWTALSTLNYSFGTTRIYATMSFNTQAYPDGTYNLRATVTDYSNNSSVVSSMVYFDHTPPPPVSGVTAQGLPGAVAIIWAPSSATDVTSYQIYCNGSYLASVTASVYAYTDYWETPGTQFSYQVLAVDSAGNKGSLSNYAKAIPLPYAPFMTVTPVQQKPGQLLIKVAGFEPYDLIGFYLDGSNIYSGYYECDSTGSYSINYSMPSNMSGTHTFKAASQYSNLSALVNFNCGPNLTLDAGLNVISNTNPYAVTGITDQGASVLVNGAAATVSQDGSFSCQVTLTEGANNIVISASNAYGIRTLQQSITLDSKPPLVTTFNPVDNSTVGGHSVSLYASARDGTGSGVDHVGFQVSRDDGATWNDLGTLQNSQLTFSTYYDSTYGCCLPYAYGHYNWDTTVAAGVYGPLADGAYKFRAVAYDKAGNASDGTPVHVWIINNTPPAAPPNLTASSGIDQINLTWSTGYAANLSSFNVYRSSTPGAGYTKIGSTSSSYYTDIVSSSSIPFYYVVTAVANSGLESQYSNEVSRAALPDQTPPAFYSIPFDNGAVIGGPSPCHITISASDNSPRGVASFKYEYSTDSGTTWSTMAGAESGPTNYYYYYYQGTISWDTTSLNSGNCILRFTGTDFSGNQASVVRNVYLELSASVPKHFTAASGNGNIVLSWDPVPDSNFRSYTIYRSNFIDQDFSVIATITSMSSGTYTDTSVDLGRTYFYKIVNTDIVGNTGTSDIASASPSLDTTPPVVTSITPADGSTTGGRQVSLQVRATDNSAVAAIEAVYSTDKGTSWQTIGSGRPYYDSGAGDYYLNVTWNTAGLTSGLYDIRIMAYDAAGNMGSLDASWTLDLSVSAATYLSTTPAVDNITVSWNAVTGAKLAGYYVLRSTASGGPYATLNTTLLSSGTTSYSDTNLAPGKTYYYVVESCDSFGNTAQSAEIAGTTLTDTTLPAIVSITPANGATVGGNRSQELDVYYNARTISGSSALVQYSADQTNWGTIATYGPYSSGNPSQPFYFTCYWNLSAVNTGTYSVSFTVYNGSGYYARQIAIYTVDRTPPGAPSNLTATYGSGNIELDWQAPSDLDTAGYQIYRSASLAGPYTSLATVNGVAATNFVDKTVQPGLTYYYEVTAIDNFAQEGTPSNIASAAAHTDTMPPQVLGISPGEGTVIGPQVQITVKAEDDLALSSITLQYLSADGSTWVDIATIATRDSATFNWDTTSLSSGAVTVRAIARDAAGNLSDGTPLRSYSIDHQGPEQVTGLTGNPSSSSVVLVWNDVSDPLFAYFQVEMKSDPAGVYQSYGTVANCLGMNVAELTPDKTYWFRVVAYDQVGNRGTPSDEIAVTTKADTQPPVVTSMQPPPGYFAKTIHLAYTASDDVAVAFLTFQCSSDCNNWVNLATPTFTPSRTVTVSYDWDVSALPEGDYYVRGIAIDEAGNSNQATAPFTEYQVDHTAPAAPTGFTVTPSAGYITLTWNQGPESDLAFYRVYRANSASGPYQLIQDNFASLGYQDRDTLENVTYYYEVTAIDKAGNEGPATGPVSAQLLQDAEPPSVVSISPVDGSMLPANPTVAVLAEDNYRLSKVIGEYQISGDTSGVWKQIGDEVIDLNYGIVYFAWNTTGLQDGDYLLRFTAIDQAGNVSDPKTISYSLNVEPPATPVLTATPGGWTVNLSWTSGNEADLAGFKVYRSKISGGLYQMIDETTKTSYCDAPLAPLDQGNAYYYVVDAIDQYQNTSRSAEVTANPGTEDPFPPKAVIAVVGGNPINVGTSVTFDGSGSSDNGDSIASYLWDFGDGNTATGERVAHTYDTAGTYSIVLTVSNPSGTSATDTATVTVLDPSQTAILEVTVVDDTTGVGIPGAQVMVDGASQPSITDGHGVAQLVLNNLNQASAGIKVDAYCNNYLPGSVYATVQMQQKNSATIRLQPGELVTGHLTVTRMTLDQISAAGIDVSSTANQYLYDFRVNLGFVPGDHEFFVNGMGDIIDYQPLTIVDNNVTETVIPEAIAYPGHPEIQPAMAFLIMPDKASWLKEMFQVKLEVINNATPDFSIDNATATLKLPSGLSLADMTGKQQQSLEEAVTTTSGAQGIINGGETAYAMWYVRGDQKGEYNNIEADFNGILEPFGDPVEKSFIAEQPIRVWGTDALKMNIYAEDYCFNGEPYRILLDITNVTPDTTVYNFSIHLSPGAGYTIPSGQWVSELIERIEPGETREFGIELYPNFDGEVDPSSTFVTSSDGGQIQTTFTTIESEREIYHLYKPPASSEADPVDTSTGAHVINRTILNVNGARQLPFDVAYNSQLLDEGPLGKGWDHGYDAHIQILDDGGAIVHWNASYWNLFIKNAGVSDAVYNAVYSPDTYISYDSIARNDHLVQNDDGSFTLTRNDQSVYLFNSSGQLTGLKDKNGHLLMMTYDNGRLATITEPISQKSLNLSYNTDGLISSVSDSSGRQVAFTYNANHYLTVITDADGKTTTYEYDSNGRILTGTNADGVKFFTDTYQDDGRIATQDDALTTNQLTQFSYDTTSQPGKIITTVTDRNGNTRVLTHNDNGLLLSSQDYLGNKTTYTYDADGNQTSVTDERSNTTNYTYDDRANLLTTTDPAGDTTTMTYDSRNNLLSVVNAAGKKSTYTYDDNNNVISATDAAGNIITYGYDSNGFLISKTTPAQGTYTYAYENGLLTTTTDPTGSTTTGVYDAAGRIKDITDAAGNTTITT
jgi:YD repeat-containing protein